MSAANHRLPASHRFQIHEPESFAAARQRKKFASGIARRQLRVTQFAQKMNVAIHSVFLRKILQPVAIVALPNRNKFAAQAISAAVLASP